MTESDIGSDKYKSSPEIKLAILEERMKEARERDRVLIASNSEVVKAVNEIKLILEAGKHRMNALETIQDETTARLLAVENDKRGPVAIILSTLSAIGTGIAAYFGFGK